MRMKITVDGVAYEVEVEMLEGAQPSARPQSPPYPPPPPPDNAPPPPRPHHHTTHEAPPGAVCSPVAGTILSVRVKAGDPVAVNDRLLVLETMKMESEVASPFAGRVDEILVAPGDVVREGQVLVKLS